MVCCYFFFKVTATTEIYTYGHTLSLHDALPILWIFEHRDACAARQLADRERDVAATARDDDRRRIDAGTIAQRDREMGRVGQDHRSLRHRLARRSAQYLVRALALRSVEHPSELQSIMSISYAVFGFKKKK